MILLLLALACSDPELEAREQALEAWDRGRLAADEADWNSALGAFDEAWQLDPGSPALAAWRARAMRETGDAEGALAFLDQAVDAAPGHPELRYGRAALRAVTGDVDGAAEDLVFLYANRLVEPTVAGDDPDFAVLATDPDTAFLVPRSKVSVESRQPASQVLLGEPWTVEAAIRSPARAPLSIDGLSTDNGRLQHLRTVEDLVERSDRMETRTVSITWSARAPGDAVMGPWRVTDGRTAALLGPFQVEVVALGDTAPPDDLPEEHWLLPSAWVGDHQPPWAGEIDGRPTVLMAPGTRGLLDGAEGDPVLLELRENGQPTWLAGVYAAGTSGTARITGSGQTLLETPLP